MKPPTDAELRSLLLDSAVHRMAQDIVNTDETIEVFLAKSKGPIDDEEQAGRGGIMAAGARDVRDRQAAVELEEDAYRR